MTPIVNGLEAEYGERLTFVKLDANTPEGRQVMESYHLRGHPAIVLFDSAGDLAWQSLGLQGREEVAAAIAQLVKP